MNDRRVDLVGLTREEVEELMAELDQPRYRGRQIFHWVQARRAQDMNLITELPGRLRAELGARLKIGRPEVVRIQRATDGTRKFLLGLGDGEQIESVLIPDDDRLTACISSQAGCPLACRF